MPGSRYIETGTRSARLGNGSPAGGGYVPGAAVAARDDQVAALAAGARRRADALPDALPRCGSCGLPAAECADTACLTVCPEHGVPLTRAGDLLVCPRRKWRCAYEVNGPRP